jgi:hypothetical protein
MRSTPKPLPDFIRDYRHQPSDRYLRRHRPYTNIYEICKNEAYVFGTESLYGDWDAELLVMAQDVGPVDEFERFRANNHPRPFTHREWREGYANYEPEEGTGGAGTNQTVHRLGEHFSCAKLYGSALIGMCRPGNLYGKNLPPVTGIRPHCVSVLRWVLDSTQTNNLRAVICLGGIARDFVARALRELPARSIPIQVFQTPHPAARDRSGKFEAVLPIWRRMARECGFEFIANP